MKSGQMWYVSIIVFQPWAYIGIVTVDLFPDQEKKVILIGSHDKEHWIRRKLYDMSLWKSGGWALFIISILLFQRDALNYATSLFRSPYPPLGLLNGVRGGVNGERA